MLEFLQNLVSPAQYIPHGHCYLWQTPLVLLHLISDALIGIAYFSIPAMLIYFVKKRQDIPFSSVFVMFGAFILLCGTGHFLNIWTLWHPAYWLTGIEQALTALVSCYTALKLSELLPQFLALKTPEQLEAINRELEQQIAERQRTEETLQMIVAGTASVIGNDFFPALVKTLATALDAPNVMLCESTDDPDPKLRSLALWVDGQLADNVEYRIAGTPCQITLEHKLLCSYTEHLQETFPDSALLRSVGAESYVGLPLLNSDQEAVGVLCILDAKPLVIDDRTQALLQVFAARAATEIQRKWAEEEKTRAYAEMEFRVVERTTELVQTNLSLETEIQQRIAAQAKFQQAAERERATAFVIQQMRQSLNLQDIFAATTAELRKVLQCDRTLIYRFHPDWSGQVVAESVSEGWNQVIPLRASQQTLTQVTVDPANCIIKHLNGTEVLIRDTYLQEQEGGLYHHKSSYCCVEDIYQREFSQCYLDVLESLQARAYVIVPIFCGNQLWGLLANYQNDNPRQWQMAEIQMIAQVGDQLGVAVQQAELFIKTQNQAEELKHAKERADTANRAKSEFLANMSHELRTPLNAILGFAQLLQRDLTLSPDQQKSVDIINTSGEHLLGLINDVLELSKIEAGRAILTETDVDLVRLLDSLDSMLRLKAQSKGLNLIFDCAATIPHLIKADENKLRQILINLLGNAIKFTHEGRVTLRVRSQVAPIHPNSEQASVPASRLMVIFEVEDTGTGIAADELSHLFQAFQQTDSGRQSQEGTGLGLRISQKFVQLMGGEITVRSEVHRGSCFSFYILVEPIEAGESVALMAAAPPLPLSSALTLDVATHPAIASTPTKPRILIAEDNATNRLLLSKMLKRLGFDIQEAENGQAAIEQWQTWHPHLIFMDMFMPRLNGYEATQKIRELEQKSPPPGEKSPQPVKIIALTASVFAEQRQRCFDIGCDDFVSKPFRQGELFEILSKHLGISCVDHLPGHPKPHAHSSPTPIHSKANHIAELSTMPPDWIGQLQFAAAQGNDTASLQLITQIPPEHNSLIQTLTNLVERYQFDQIIELIQSIA